jgi:putative restriction endonuclease
LRKLVSRFGVSQTKGLAKAIHTNPVSKGMPTFSSVPQDFRTRFARLHTQRGPYWTDRTRHQAPNKPLLLLTVLDLFAQGTIQVNLIEPNDELGDLFASYWELVMPVERRGNLAMPFFHLRSEGFWHLVARPGQEAKLASFSTMTSLPQLREIILGATLEEELFVQMQQPAVRASLRAVLVETYFAPELHIPLFEHGETNVKSFHYGQALIELAHSTKKVKEAAEAELYVAGPVRAQGFRRVVVAAYEHRCAFCGIRMQTAEGRTAVDAAHIKPWSISHNDDPRNGLALCRLCHWTFDVGLLGVSEQYTLLAAKQLSAAPNVPGHLATLPGRNIFLPNDDALWPDKAMLQWHRKNLFGGK